MKRSLIRTLFLIILLLLAVVVGQLLGAACAGTKYFSWLGASASFGLSTVQLDLSIVKFTFGMLVKINVSQAILLLLAILTYTKIKIKE